MGRVQDGGELGRSRLRSAASAGKSVFRPGGGSLEAPPEILSTPGGTWLRGCGPGLDHAAPAGKQRPALESGRARRAAREAAWAERRAFPRRTGERGASGSWGLGGSPWATGAAGPQSGPRSPDGGVP
ncbi:hypothetical protein NDU88_003046 [Pleurodeles waltl]|uniref:Uncharacterized protein n=1 Tax=Pleurodeles waltl TaxID=8319 RepID=A0AAV7TNK8_PLEWA|nr:hypothetical protein NDU88_003046 [Pleurodeles waltl]